MVCSGANVVTNDWVELELDENDENELNDWLVDDVESSDETMLVAINEIIEDKDAVERTELWLE